MLISPGVGSGVVRTFTKDWQFGLIVQKRSGSPLTPAVSNDNALTGEPNQVPLIVDGVDPYMDEPTWVPNAEWHHTQLQWINMAAFANAPAGQRGNTRRGHIYGPGFFNTDLAVSRNLNLSPGKHIELRVEMFNLFNTVNWSNPNVTVGSATAGQITIDGQRSTHHAVSDEVRVLARAPHYQRPGLAHRQAWSRHLREFSDL